MVMAIRRPRRRLREPALFEPHEDALAHQSHEVEHVGRTGRSTVDDDVGVALGDLRVTATRAFQTA